jgi:hypothetical protein
MLAVSAVVGAPVAQADRAEPPPLYGWYDVSVDFAKQTFNGTPTPMESKTFPVQFTTHCDGNGCVVTMDNSDDLARDPKAPASFEYSWHNGRWETSTADFPYLCERMNADSAVQAVRSDFLIPRPDGSFFGERTLVVAGAGCPGEGPGTHWVPISVTPIDPPH